MNKFWERSNGIYIMVESYELNSKGQTRKLHVILESNAKLNLFFSQKIYYYKEDIHAKTLKDILLLKL